MHHLPVQGRRGDPVGQAKIRAGTPVLLERERRAVHYHADGLGLRRIGVRRQAGAGLPQRLEV